MGTRVRERSAPATSASGYTKTPSGKTYYNLTQDSAERTEDATWNYWSYRRGLEKRLRASPDNRSYKVALEAVNTYDQGGPFLSQSVDFISNPGTVNCESFYYGLVGDLLPHSDCAGSFSFKEAVPGTTMFARGGQAIYACRPMRPEMSATVNIGELFREGLPSIPGKFFRRPGLGSASDEFLNYEFGIKPTVSAVNDTVKAFRQADRTWAQITRDAGRDVRRRYYFPAESSFTHVLRTPGYGYPIGAGVLYDVVGTCYKNTLTESQTWFSGAFRYALPGGADRWSRFRREATRWEQVYGLGLKPIDLYRLTPWSWLLEWAADYSSAISWLGSSAFDGVAMRYGYIMCHTVETTTWVLTGLKFKATSAYCSSSFSCQKEVKQRTRASPYGFGLEEEDLTTEQQAILVALGLSKSNPYRAE